MEEEDEKVFPFHEMGLDDRILKSIAKLGWSSPTLIQEKAIPLILSGQDVLCRGRTGSGKTGAFAIPIIQKILRAKQQNSCEQASRALILAPSRELSSQIHGQLSQLAGSCGRVVRCVDLARNAGGSERDPVESMRPLLVDKPDIIVGTPSRLVKKASLLLSLFFSLFSSILFSAYFSCILISRLFSSISAYFVTQNGFFPLF